MISLYGEVDEITSKNVRCFKGKRNSGILRPEMHPCIRDTVQQTFRPGRRRLLFICKFGRTCCNYDFRVLSVDYEKCSFKKDYKIHVMFTLERYITIFEVKLITIDDGEAL